MTKTWDDYLEECLPLGGRDHVSLPLGGKHYDSSTQDTRIGIRIAFNFIKDNFPPAATCDGAANLEAAVEAAVRWFDAEDESLGTFHDRMDLCCYAEWAARKSLGQDVGDFQGVPRLLITTKETP